MMRMIQSSSRASIRLSVIAVLAVAGLMIGLSALPHRAFADDAKTDALAKKKDAKRKAVPAKDTKKMPALQFKMKDIDGKDQNLAQYHGNVILVVNVASECGLTPQYKGLQELYDTYKDQGFVVLGFPANEFGRQEPGSDSVIKDFCTKNFKVTFPMFSKVVVKGEGICPLFSYLTSKEAGHEFGGEIAWNFNKFLIDREGRVIGRFEPRTAPNAEPLVEAVTKALEQPIPPDSALAKQKKATSDAPSKKRDRQGH